MPDISKARVLIIATDGFEQSELLGRTLTSWPSIRTDLHNAGAEVIDEEVVVDGNLITSRKPDDIPAFNDALIRAIEAA